MTDFNPFWFLIAALVVIGFFALDFFIFRKNHESAKFSMNDMPREMRIPNELTCIHKDYCGGCAYNGIDYDVVRKDKDREVRTCFREKAGLILFDKYDRNRDVELKENERVFQGEYLGMQGMQYKWRYHYRNKMEYTFGDFTKDGELELGMHKKGNYMSIVTVDHCQLVPEDFNQILGYTLSFAKSSGLKHYHKKTHRGVFRNLIVRRGVRTGEILVDLVTSSEADGYYSSDKPFDAQGWMNGLLSLKLKDKNNKIVGIMHTINDNIADAVNCDEQRILFGRDYYYEEICGLKFKVNIFSFFQTNVEAVERLYQEAVALLPDLEGKTVYDLFCGTGTISQIVAKSAKEVVGVEIVRDSVEAAEVNVKLNEIDNCSFVCGDVFDVLTAAGLGEQETEDAGSSAVRLPNPDVIIVDPPRIGLRTKTVNKIASYRVPEILYISCNPKTLAMDLADFKPLGYEPMYIKAYDNFCWTKHVEAVVLLKRRGDN